MTYENLLLVVVAVVVLVMRWKVVFNMAIPLPKKIYNPHLGKRNSTNQI